MAQTITISLDAMGGDTGPETVIGGAAIAIDRRPDLRFLIFGEEDVVRPVLDADPRVKERSLFHHCDISVQMDDKPSQALRKGRWKSSMWRAIQAVKDHEAGAAVSAGNTGALMVMSKICLKPLPGIERPAIAALWPTLRGESIVLDVGATIGADASMLVDFAVMGAAMARSVFGLDRPTVGLLNVGVEEMKGLEEVREAGRILRERDYPGLDYRGFIEGDDLGRGTVDVAVTEGFSGNIALEDGGGDRPADRRISALRHGAHLGGAAWLSLRAVGLPAASGEDGSAQGEWRRLPRAERRRHQVAWRHRRRGLCERHRPGARDGEERPRAHDRRGQRAQRRSAGIRTDRGGLRMKRSVVRGIGSYLPAKVLTNADLATMVDTSDEWIVQRTGIRERHIAAEGEVTSDLATAAAKKALQNAGLKPTDIDLIVLATSTPDNTFPASAVTVQDNLGIHSGAAFDLQAVCTGFVYALTVADALLEIRPGRTCARHRRGDLFAHPRLERPHHLRALR